MESRDSIAHLGANQVMARIMGELIEEGIFWREPSIVLECLLSEETRELLVEQFRARDWTISFHPRVTAGGGKVLQAWVVRYSGPNDFGLH